jgi:hypothetical protein
MEEEGDGFRVGWFSSKLGRECGKDYSNLADEATDYLLFSLGKGRWAPEGVNRVETNPSPQ